MCNLDAFIVLVKWFTHEFSRVLCFLREGSSHACSKAPLPPCKLRNARISKNVVENGEWQLLNGDCTTERNCSFHIWYAKFQSLLCPWSKIDMPTIDVSLRVRDPSNKRNPRFFQVKSVPRFGNVLELKRYILEHYQNETKAQDTSFEFSYLPRDRRLNITNQEPISWSMQLSY